MSDPDLISTALASYGVPGVIGAAIAYAIKAFSDNKTKKLAAQIDADREERAHRYRLEKTEREENRTKENIARVEHRSNTLNRISTIENGIADMFTEVRAIATAQRTASMRVHALEDLLRIIIESSAGSLSIDLIRNHVGTFSGKVHAEIDSWYKRRIIENHILESPNVVAKRYKTQLASVLDRWKWQLEKYHFKGVPLIGWDPALEGLKSVYSRFFDQLYRDQVATTLGKEPYLRNIPEELDHLQSKLMSSAVRWAHSDIVLKNELDVDELNSTHGIEFLQDFNPTKGDNNGT